MTTERLAELDERDHQLEQRMAELRHELATVQRDSVSETAIRPWPMHACIMAGMSEPTAEADARPGWGSGLAGRVNAIWRYPVKSTYGESLTTVRVTARGLRGDRAFALVDRATRKVASAKHPRKWGRLLEIRSSFIEVPAPGTTPSVTMLLPDGTTIHGDDPDCDERLGQVLGRPVDLVETLPENPLIERYWPDVAGLAPDSMSGTPGRVTEGGLGGVAPAGTFFDFASIHVITTATLNALDRLHPGGHVALIRFRPNLVIETAADAPPFIEDTWVGRTFAIGAEVAVTFTHPTPRCVVPTLPGHGLSSDLDVLRTIARHHRVEMSGLGWFACAGVYGQIVRDGTIRLGDAARSAPE